jgi:hypothetical protein
MLVADVLVEIDRARRQEMLRERERDRLAAQACPSAPNQWRLLLARSLHALAARIESSAPASAVDDAVVRAA